jgi:hypothetical protein
MLYKKVKCPKRKGCGNILICHGMISHPTGCINCHGSGSVFVKTEEDEWKPIPGYESTHEINIKGQVRSLKRFKAKERILKPFINHCGYEMQHICVNGKNKNITTHRLLAITFMDALDFPELQINHKDGNKLNNDLSNLELVTASENVKHAYRTGLTPLQIGHFVSEETKKKLSEKRKGYILTDEHKRKIGESVKLARSSDEMRQKISNALTGRVLSEEAKRRIGEAHKGKQYCLGRKHTEESKQKMSESLKGRVVSAETRKKLSEALRGYKHTEEAKRNMSIAQKRRFACPDWTAKGKE